MNAESSPLTNEESVDSPNVVYRRISRALDYSTGFWLGFAKCNLPPQRKSAVNVCKELLAPLNVRVVEVQMDHSSEEILPLIEERLATAQTEFQRGVDTGTLQTEDSFSLTELPKWAIFLYGIEHSIRSADSHEPILSYLNMNRERFQQKLPYALLIWLPEYALVALSRQAADFWAWRSGFYELASQPDSARELLDPIHRLRHSSSSLSGVAKRENLALFRGLLADYAELERGHHELLVEHRILMKIGLLHQEIGEYVEARQSFVASLSIAQELSSESLALSVKHRLGRLAQIRGDYPESLRIFTENLHLARASQNNSQVPIALYQLGRLEQEYGDLDKAKALLVEALEIRRATQHALGTALSLIQLGKLEEKKHHHGDAQRFFKESLKISRDHGLSSTISQSLDSLAMVKRHTGDLYEAQRLIESSIKIRRESRDRFGESFSLTSLGVVKYELGYYEEAKELLKQSLKIKREISDPKGEMLVLQRLAIVCWDSGSKTASREYEKRAQEISAQLGLHEN
jgi:tetratricopeptide (TPR) repeat protein